jgi:predicted dehydrogenase
MMDKIKWGIIGCGDVTELKSGPAFNKINNSQLVAVMRRDAAKAKDYASRHNVPAFYSDAALLINDENVNAMYIATPPDSHEEYAMAAMAAGKPVYVEKPMTLDQYSAKRMMDFSAEKKIKLSLAHYRNAQPMFMKIKELLDKNTIGKILHTRLDYRRKSATALELSDPKTAWRFDPAKSGGGLFHDLAPHQLGLMVYFFGEAEKAAGVSGNSCGSYAADDMVSGSLLFKNGIQFSGSWCFNASERQETDRCEIFGTGGSISFTVFNQQKILLETDKGQQVFHFPPLQHVQQPMIEKVVGYFRGQLPNPCPAEQGYAVMEIMDAFTPA